MQSPQDCARAGLRAYQRNKAYTVSALSFRLTAWSVRLVPRAFAARLGAEFARPGGPFSAG
jgi:short-subunit dehydrogenase